MTDTQDTRSQEPPSQEAVQSLQDERGAFVVAAESTRMAMIFMDAQASGHLIVFANDSFLRMTGYARPDVLGQPVEVLFAFDDLQDSASLSDLETAFERDTDGELELCCRRKDRSTLWVGLFVTAVHDKQGVVQQHFASFIDLTRHRKAQGHSRMMIDELNHRVKNTLATVQAIVWQALRRESSPSQIQAAIESRIFALSRSHDLLTRSNWEGVTLHDLARASMAPFEGIDDRSDRLSIVGPDVTLISSVALALGIAFHELATNAVKYGALSNTDGSISIVWAHLHWAGGNGLVIHWREDGGPAVAVPENRGFGSRVIERGLPHELGGSARLDFRPQGLVCTIELPMQERTVRV
jgi:PAS domain S-box-containing protein